MLSHHEKQEVINILNDVLGVGTSMKNDEQIDQTSDTSRDRLWKSFFVDFGKARRH